jgi:amino acid adenylation domain-containing protein
LEIEPLIGFFVNTLVLRTEVSGEQSFVELLGEVRRNVLEAYGHQDLPFEKLVEELQPERDLSRSPLFQVMIALQNARVEQMRLSQISVTGFDLADPYVKFDLGLLFAETELGIHGVLDYSTDLFSWAFAERAASHFVSLLNAVLSEPYQSIGEMTFLSERERHQLLVSFNKNPIGNLSSGYVHEWFARQAGTAPDRIAVVCNEQHISYGELQKRSNWVAHYLRGLGTKPDSRVAVCMESSPEMIGAFLGILKAGAAYVPIDPTNPTERIAYMVADSQAEILLLRESGLDKLGGIKTRVVCLENCGQDNPDNREEYEGRGIWAENLAYVIYTSGSTGHPKGVMVSHKGLQSLSCWHQQTYELSGEDRTSQLSSVGFDAMVWEVWPTLAAGGSLHIASRETRTNPDELLRWLIEKSITVSFVPTPLAEMLLGREWPRSALRALLTGGDQLHHGYGGGEESFKLFNHYGPTEGTVVATYGEAKQDEQRGKLPAIGKPISGTKIYVLDRRMQPVAMNVKGEIYIAGRGLARGYLGEAGLTAECFVPDPFCKEEGSRMYRTGDLGRWREDEKLEFVGRIDGQVKLRGMRIELGEIESVLSRHLAVESAAVVLREEGEKGKQLIAYLVVREDASGDKVEWRRYVRERLPEYMVPAHFVMLEELPLTANGKLDRKALPDPHFSSAEFSGHSTLPIEEIICGIYKEVLRLDRVSVRDSFFQLGGHSLLATQVASRIREIFNLELPLRALFENEIVKDLARYIEAAIQLREGVVAPSLAPVDREDLLPLSHAQQRLWFREQMHRGDIAYNVPFALKLTGQLDIENLCRSLEEIVRRHEILRTCFPIHDLQPVQKINLDWNLPVEHIDLSKFDPTMREHHIAELSEMEARQSFDLARGPLLRVKLLRITPDQHILLITMHHIVCDGWSLGIITRELSSLYESFILGKPSPLPELPIQYADFAVWQKSLLQGEVLERHLDYWRKQLDGCAELDLPTDFARSIDKSREGAVISFILDRSLTSSLKALSQQHGATLFMTLLACFQVLLARFSNQNDVTVGVSIANRNRLETETLIGYFVNNLPIRHMLQVGQSFTDFLSQMRTTLLDAYAHQDLPFDRLVEELRVPRTPGYTPLFQVGFAFQNIDAIELKLTGLVLEELESPVQPAKIDLMLFAANAGQNLHCRVHYDSSLFAPWTINRIIHSFTMVCEQICAEPSLQLAKLANGGHSITEQSVKAFNDDLNS